MEIILKNGLLANTIYRNIVTQIPLLNYKTAKEEIA